MLTAVLWALALGTSTLAASSLQQTTEANRAVIARFADLLYGRREVREAFECCVCANYVQHSPAIGDGRRAAIRVLQPMFARQGFRLTYRRPIVDGDMAVVMMHAGIVGSRGGAIADIYKLRNSCIVEHWDLNEPIPATAANSYPFF